MLKIKTMKTIKFILTFFLLSTSLTGYSQLNPIKNLYWNHWYENPNNFYILKWSPPDTSLTDTLVGYNIYRNNILYRFYTDTIAKHIIPQDTSFGGEDFVHTYGGPFYIYVTAVYNSNHLESMYNDSALCYGAAVSLNDIKMEIIRIYPNPFTTQTTLQIDKELPFATIAVYNSFGQQVKQINNITGQSVIISRDNLPNGLYFLKLTKDNEIIDTRKIVITD